MDVLNTISKQHKDKLQHHLISQGSFSFNTIRHSTLIQLETQLDIPQKNSLAKISVAAEILSRNQNS
jgi:hypothetical protein